MWLLDLWNLVTNVTKDSNCFCRISHVVKKDNNIGFVSAAGDRRTNCAKSRR